MRWMLQGDRFSALPDRNRAGRNTHRLVDEAPVHFCSGVMH